MTFNRMKKSITRPTKQLRGKECKKEVCWVSALLSRCSQQPGCLSGRAGLGGAEDRPWWWYNFLFISHIASVEAKILTLDTAFMDECFEFSSLSPQLFFTE